MPLCLHMVLFTVSMLIFTYTILLAQVFGACGMSIHVTRRGPRGGFCLKDESIRNTLHSIDDHNEQSLSKVYERLISSTNVETLILGTYDRSDESQFSFREGDRFPALEGLCITGDYDFDDYLQRRRKRLGIESWERESWLDKLQNRGPLGIIDQYLLVQNLRRQEEPKLSNLEHWIDAMDWSHLTLLELWSLTPGFLQKMGPHLTSLRTLRLSERYPRFWGEDAGVSVCDMRTLVNCFLSQLPVKSLRDVGLLGCWDADTVQELLDHGASLKRLELRENWHIHSLTASELERIGLSCPYLESIAIDVSRNVSSWPWEKFAALRNFKQLTRLEIFFEPIFELVETEERFEDNYKEAAYELAISNRTTALVSYRAAIEIFKFIKDGSEGAPLRAATFHGAYRGTLTCSPFEEDGTYKPEGIGWCEGFAENEYPDDYPEFWQ